MKNYIFGYPDLYVYQNDDLFKMSLDSVLLSNFVTLKKSGLILDIGTGNAPIPIVLSRKTNSKIIGVEIQKDLYELAVTSVFINNLDNRVELLNKDIKEVYKEFRSDSFDTIVSNPPYFKVTENINEKDSFNYK